MPKPCLRTITRYSEAFRATAVRLSQLPGVAVGDVAELLYIHPYMVSRWRKLALEERIVVKLVDVDPAVSAELKALRQIKRQYERLKIEHDPLQANVSSWLDRVASSETPLQSIVAYNVGLFETPDGFSAYLIGAASYDSESDDWACDEVFSPTERYLPLPSSKYPFASWQVALAAVAEAVRSALESPAVKESFLGRAHAITVGFDDGDLVRVA